MRYYLFYVGYDGCMFNLEPCFDGQICGIILCFDGRHVSDAKRLVALNKTYLMSSGCLIDDAVSQCSFGRLCVTVVNSRSTQ